MPTQTLTSKLEAFRMLIFNSHDADVAPLLDDIGIDGAHIDAGISLYNETMALVQQQKLEYQEQSRAYDAFYIERDAVESAYNRSLKLVKIVTRADSDLQNRLGLQNNKNNTIEGWIDGAIDFYNRLLNESNLLSSLARFKLTEDVIHTQVTDFQALRNLRNQAIVEKGQSQEATRQRNEKLDELEDYARELKAIAKLALEQRPQLLEKLGVVVRS